MGVIWVIAEHRQGVALEVTLEMLCLANRLGSQNDMQVAALVMGRKSPDLAETLKNACDRVLIMEDPRLDDYNADPYLCAIETIFKTGKPVLILIGHTAVGIDLAPALSVRLSVPLVTDCEAVSFSDNEINVLRYMYGGKIGSRLLLKPSNHYILSIRPGTFPAEQNQGKEAEVRPMVVPTWTDLRGRRFIEYLESQLADMDIATADILVSVGRGIGKPENITLAQDFADAIGATLACSRPVADKGWMSKGRQVGTSGKTVRPRMYIALGISGAFQHQVGMKQSETIIAINKDPKAPIFNVAHYGIVADLFQVVPQITEMMRSEKK